ncbi:hypothetical protein MKEN_00078900 [Mycena kentingensis (nom. inval.)]|nr:hypothetical protein MKEN_00078900 [Mycena kentingensis (nom. inval.)]
MFSISPPSTTSATPKRALVARENWGSNKRIKLEAEHSTAVAGFVQELVVSYEPQPTTQTDLFHQLDALNVSASPLNRYVPQALRICQQIGHCSADLLWRRALIASTEPIDPAIQSLIKNWPFKLPNLDPASRGFNVSHKFLRLVQILQSCQLDDEDFRGLIFVHHRETAFAIVEIMSMVAELLQTIRPIAFTQQTLLRTDDSQQQEIFRKFSSGVYNLLVVSKSGEDLDYPQATLVVRFDLSDGPLASILVGNAIASTNGHLIHMVERSNRSHLHVLASTRTSESVPRSLSDGASRTSFPPLVLEASDDEDEEPHAIIEPVTGGQITPQNAVAVVCRLASRLTLLSVSAPLFDFHRDKHRYVCEISLPNTPVHRVTGQPCTSRAHARRSACYNACMIMRNDGLLEPSEFPAQYSPPSPYIESSEATPELENGGSRTHARKLPDVWSRMPSNGSLLFPLVVIVHKNRHAPILLLTRAPVPSAPFFNLFSAGAPTKVEIEKCAPFMVDENQIALLHAYTLRVCRSLVNKSLTCALASMPYFFAPLPMGWARDPAQPWTLPQVEKAIQWTSVTVAAQSWFTPLKYGSADVVAADVEDALVLDRQVEHARRYEVQRVRADLNPLSRPEDSPREAGHASLLDYCRTVRKNFDGLNDEKQALVEIASVIAPSSCLDPFWHPPPATSASPIPRYLIPELCFKFTIPASTFRTALLLPSILYRLDTFFLVKELNARMFQHNVSDALLDTALHSPSSRMEVNYERLEFLGDSFLKFLASVYIFVHEPTNKEGALHYARQDIISNRALFRCVEAAGLPPYIQSKGFAIKNWRPPNFSSPEDANVSDQLAAKKRKKEGEQRLGDKVVADVAEAVLGAAYLTGGIEAALRAAKGLRLPLSRVERWSDLRADLLVPPPKISAALKPGALAAIETIIGCKFTHQHLLAQALTHSSLSRFDRVSYEKLEFIGDAILDFLVGRHVFARDAKLTPGGLTLVKAAMVSNPTLAAICVESQLHKHIWMASHIQTLVSDYARKLETSKAEETALAKQEGRATGQYWQAIEPPKVLSDVIESVIGALYLSDDLSAAEAFFSSLLQPFYDQYLTLKTLHAHPTKTLSELLQASRCHKFKIAKDKVPGGALCQVVVHDVTLSSGEGSSVSLAARQASLNALAALEDDVDFFARVCDCPKDKERKQKVLDLSVELGE